MRARPVYALNGNSMPEKERNLLDPEHPGDTELVGQVQHASDDISRAMTAT